MPDALALHMRHQHQRRRGLEGRGAAIGGVAPEQLAQARIAEVLAERPHRVVKGWMRSNPPSPDRPTRRPRSMGLGPLAQDERALQGAVDLGRAGAKAAIAVLLAGAGKGPDRRRRFLGIGEQIEALVRPPGMAGENGGRAQPHAIRQVGAALRKDLLEDPAHGEDGGAGLHPRPVRRDAAHLAAGRRRAFQHGDVEPRMGEAQGRHQPADSRSDHRNPLRRHCVTCFCLDECQ